MSYSFRTILSYRSLVLPNLVEFALYCRLWNLPWAGFFLVLGLVPDRFKWSHSQRFTTFLFVADAFLLLTQSYTELLLAPFVIGMVSFARYIAWDVLRLFTRVSYFDILDTLHEPLYKALFRVTTSPSSHTIQTAIRDFDTRISKYSFDPPPPVEAVLQYMKQKSFGFQAPTSETLQMSQLAQLLDVFVYLLKRPMYEEEMGGIPLQTFQTNYLENGLLAEYMRMSIWDSYVDRMNWRPILDTVLTYLENNVELMQRVYGGPVKETYQAFKPVLDRYLSHEQQLQYSLAKVAATVPPHMERLLDTGMELESV